MLPNEVFLSHSSKNHAVAKKLAEALVAHGIPTFFSPRNIRGGQQWQNEILVALERCDWFLVLLSPDAIQSMWVKRETALALNDPRFQDNRIIPLRYRACDLGPLGWLKSFQMIDFEHRFDDGLQALLRQWGVGMLRTSSAVKAPKRRRNTK